LVWCIVTCVADEDKKKKKEEEEADFVYSLALERTAIFAALLIILNVMIITCSTKYKIRSSLH
jgi:heme/copper-type cytochrome/quinol oxidase subunit 2